MTQTPPQLFSARIGESCVLAERIAYDELLRRIMEFTVRAALARTVDESEWEHDELRRKGLAAIDVFRNEKAIWTDERTFSEERAAAQCSRDLRFERFNELDPALYARINRDLRHQWRRAGYDSPCLLHDMKKLFDELERDAADRAAGARESLLVDLLNR